MKITKIAHIISQEIFNSNYWPRRFTMYSLLKVLELSEKKMWRDVSGRIFRRRYYLYRDYLR